MSLKKLPYCCRNVVKGMQDTSAMGTALKTFLLASPFILILPDLLLPGSSSEAVETLAEKMVQMTGEKVVTNVTKTAALPDFADSVRAVNTITLGLLHRQALTHSNFHAQPIEGKLWKSMREIYDEKGPIRSGGGWDLNPFW